MIEENDVMTYKIGNYFKVSIDQNYPIEEFHSKMKSNDKYSLFSLIRNCILWNSKLQRVNNGSIYIFVVNNRLYNVLINKDKIKIVEITRNEEIEEERLLSYEIDSEEYYYFSVSGIKNKGIVSTKYYNKVEVDLGRLNYTDNEASNEIASVLNNISQFEDIKTIVDIDFIREKVLTDIQEKKVNKHY